MTSVMEKLIHAAEKLPEKVQAEYVERWLAEIEDDRRWDESFAKSQGVLADLAAEALAEDAAGQSKPFPRTKR